MLKNLTRKELYFYIGSACGVVIGLVFLIIGIIADHLAVTSALYKMQAAFPWRYIGLIIVGASIIFAIVVLVLYAKKIDRVSDRELRRKHRLSAMMSDVENKEQIIANNPQTETKVKEDNVIINNESNNDHSI